MLTESEIALIAKTKSIRRLIYRTNIYHEVTSEAEIVRTILIQESRSLHKLCKKYEISMDIETPIFLYEKYFHQNSGLIYLVDDIGKEIIFEEYSLASINAMFYRASIDPTYICRTKLKSLKFEKFLDQNVIFFDNLSISRRKIVDYFANKVSGAHFSERKDLIDLSLDRIRASIFVSDAAGKNPVIHFPGHAEAIFMPAYIAKEKLNSRSPFSEYWDPVFGIYRSTILRYLNSPLAMKIESLADKTNSPKTTA